MNDTNPGGENMSAELLKARALNRISKIHVDLKQRGELIQDADIFIAATALIRNLTLVSNDSHFQRLEDLTTENWITDQN